MQKSAIKSERHKLLASIHIKKKELGLDDGDYRAHLKQWTGLNSSAGMTNKQLKYVLVQFNTMMQATQPPNYEVKGKVKALWLSGYHLGLIDDDSETALRAFIKRQLKIDHENWMRPQLAYKVIEGLKDWLNRDGGVDWAKHQSNPRKAVILAQWRKLYAQGKVPVSSATELQRWMRVQKYFRPIEYLYPNQQDGIIKKLGAWIRGSNGTHP